MKTNVLTPEDGNDKKMLLWFECLSKTSSKHILDKLYVYVVV